MTATKAVDVIKATSDILFKKYELSREKLIDQSTDRAPLILVSFLSFMQLVREKITSVVGS